MLKTILSTLVLAFVISIGIAQTKTFENYAVSIQYPTNWEFSQDGGAPGMLFMIKSKLDSKQDKFQENINLMVQDISSYGLDLASFTKLSEGQITSMINNAKIISSTSITKGGLSAQRVVFTGAQSGFDLKFEQFYWVQNGTAYISTFTAEASKFDAYSHDATAIMESFKIK